MSKIPKIILSILLALSTIALIFTSFIFHSLLESQIKESTVLNEDTAELWAEFPGESKVEIFQDYYLYHIEDKKEFMKNLYDNSTNAQPSIKEIKPYRLQEKQSFLYRSYDKVNKTVEYSLYKRVELTKSRQNNDISKYNINNINIAALGVWRTAKNIPRESIALTALYSVYTGFRDDLLDQFIHTALTQLSSTIELFRSQYKLYHYKEKDEILEKFYNNKQYGFKIPNGYIVKAYYENKEGKFEKTDFLKDYFELTSYDMLLIYSSMEVFIKKVINISGRDFLKESIDKDLAARYQWHLLSVVDGSVFDMPDRNSTIPGYIEYQGYLNKYKNNYKSKLTVEQVKALLALNDNSTGIDNLNKVRVDDSNSLFNKQNMDMIMKEGISKEESIRLMDTLLNISDKEEAGNLYDYLNYLVYDIGILSSKNGNKQIAAMSSFVNSVLYPTISKIGDVLFDNLLLKYVKYSIFLASKEIPIQKNPCYDFIVKYCFNIDGVVTRICDKYNIFDDEVLRKVWIPIVVYENFHSEIYKIVYSKTIYYDYFTQKESMLYQIFNSAIKNITSIYNIEGKSQSTFNKLDFGIKQYTTGEITRKEYQLDSVCQLFDENGNNFFTYNPEIYIYCKETNVDCSKFNEEFFKRYANFDNFFSSFYIQNLLIDYFYPTTKTNLITQTDPILSSTDFINYLRHLVIDEAFGGLILSHTPNEIIFGYESRLLNDIKNTNYYIGGDPTVNSIVSLANKNEKPDIKDESSKWKMFTGEDDISKVRTYKKVMGYENKVMMKVNYFNGNSIISNYQRPWMIDFYLNGTDAMSFKPLLKKEDKPKAYLDDLMRIASFNFYNEKEYFDFNLYRFTLDNTLILKSDYNKENEIFYMNKYNGFGNQTSILNSPLFVSKPYYKDCNDSYYADIVNKPKKSIYKNNIKSDNEVNEDEEESLLLEESILDVEPYTGAVVRAVQKLLISVLIEKDELFNIKSDTFVPINYLFRSGNLTKEGMNILSDLKTGLNIEFYGRIFSGIGVVLFFCLLIFFCRKKDISSNSNDEENNDSGIKNFDNNQSNEKLVDTEKNTERTTEIVSENDKVNLLINDKSNLISISASSDNK